MTAAEISSIDRGQGRVDLDRERIEAGVDQIGSPAQLMKPLKDAIDAYFGVVAPWLEKEVLAARSDGKYGINSEDELAAKVVPAVQSFFVVRDAALTEAAERAGAARDSALIILALAGLAVVALIGVLAGVTVMLPWPRDHAARDPYRCGRRPRRWPHDVTIPTIDRADEIGAMAVRCRSSRRH